MNKTFLIFLLTLLPNFTFAQFEGELIYKVDISSDFLKKLANGKSIEDLKKANNYYDTLTVYIKAENFITNKNNNFHEQVILIEKHKTEYTISQHLLSEKGKKILTKIDLGIPPYNKDNFTQYSNSDILISQLEIDNKKCTEYQLKNEQYKISEKFIVCDSLPKTSIVRNYLIPPYTGQNLNSEHYKPFRNKVIYAYELDFQGIKYTAKLISIKADKIKESIFYIPKTNKKGIIIDE